MDQEPVEVATEEKKEFAKDQLRFLRKNGIEDRIARGRIFKAAGPGQIQESWKLAQSVKELDITKKDMILCILAGAGNVRIGYDRFRSVLQTLGVYTPDAFCPRQFFRIVAGAKEILRALDYQSRVANFNE